MSGTKYANAVGAVRAMENSLISKSDLERLINAKNIDEIHLILSQKCISLQNNALDEVWNMLNEYAPECKELEILLYKNDFHNLKAVLKALISNREPSDYYISPSNVELKALVDSLNNRDYSELPIYMQKTAADAYELLTNSLDGQLSDSLIDKSAIQAMQKSADDFGSDFMKKYSCLIAVCADIKTTYRCIMQKKSRQFMDTALSGSDKLDKNLLINSASEGIEAFFAFLETTPYSEAATMLKESPAKFEKWCDDIIIELAESARTMAFGAEPLAAYYIARETEQKNLRILSVCKEFGADKKTITERMRKLYV